MITRKINKLNIDAGITIIEILVAMAIALTLAGAAVYYYQDAVTSSKVSALKQTLNQTRQAIDSYYKGHASYTRLENLVPAYLRSLPYDPVMQVYDWTIVQEDFSTCPSSNAVYTGAYDIKSTSPAYGNL
jgi:type II secretory pathway pseudopilin PulG